PNIEVNIPVIEVNIPVIEVNIPVIEVNIPVIEVNIPVIEVNIPNIEVNIPVIEVNIPVIEVNIPNIEVNFLSDCLFYRIWILIMSCSPRARGAVYATDRGGGCVRIGVTARTVKNENAPACAMAGSDVCPPKREAD
ncbi:MAG: hypothetical protein LBF85_01350, partial [Tannerella sp.]|nr:hypothetical protein [Tannerella sp.]